MKKYESHLIELQNRIVALEGANAGASNDLENFHTKYKKFFKIFPLLVKLIHFLRRRLKGLAAESTLLNDLSADIKIHLNEMKHFRAKLKTLEDAVDVGANEQKIWQLKLNDLLTAHDKRNEELINLREKIDSLAKADCNCSSLITGQGKARFD